jgi:hypothetical protein
MSDPYIEFEFRKHHFMVHMHILKKLPLLRTWWFTGVGRNHGVPPPKRIFDNHNKFRDVLPEAKHLNAFIRWAYTDKLDELTECYNWTEFTAACDFMCNGAPAHGEFALQNLVSPKPIHNFYWSRGWWWRDFTFLVTFVGGFGMAITFLSVMIFLCQVYLEAYSVTDERAMFTIFTRIRHYEPNNATLKFQAFECYGLIMRIANDGPYRRNMTDIITEINHGINAIGIVLDNLYAEASLLSTMR